MTLELCWQLTGELALNLGAIAATRYGIVGTGSTNGTRDAAIRTAALGVTAGILQSAQLTLTDTSYATPGSYEKQGTSTSGSGQSGTFVVYTLVYVQPFMTGLPKLILGYGSITHSATVFVQNEPY